jgi:hypothetical protein
MRHHSNQLNQAQKLNGCDVTHESFKFNRILYGMRWRMCFKMRSLASRDCIFNLLDAVSFLKFFKSLENCMRKLRMRNYSFGFSDASSLINEQY